MMLLRSMLFTPGNNMRMITKAGARGADAVILDLEDSVPVPDKETARLFVRDAMGDIGRHGSRVFVRVNAPETGLCEADLAWVVREGLDGIILPKAENRSDVVALSDRLDGLEAETERGLASGSIAIVPLLESAKGIVNAHAVASASPRVAALAFGGVDFCRDMGIDRTDEGTELLYARAHVAISARAVGIFAVDTPCLATRDRERLLADARAARGLGFRGKLLIHPSQVDPVNEVFSPPQAGVARAREIVAAFEEAREQGAGAISLDGKMIDEANYRQAVDLLATAEIIATREAKWEA